ncbi:MAG: hypothetical protein HY912_22110 [Desulfomonile tiedjei]|uniref:Uncharacterized protein n=1 Tax=Desulfomonile tiedjei TaxID=2358 RepID=A0A9D6V7L1_9BACT|nr:hypothetical protein [Desulfomonile tiedjei]
MDWRDLLFILLVVAASALVWAYVMRGKKRQDRFSQIWREFAELKSLKELPSDKYRDNEAVIITFQGKNQGMPFVLECVATEGTPMQVGSLRLSRGEDTRIFTRMQIMLPGLPRGLRVYRETQWSKLGKAVGMQDIITGDPEFDRAFMVKGNDVTAVNNYLTSSRRMVLLARALSMDGLELQEQGLTIFKQGQMETAQELEEHFSQLGSVAAELVRS